MINKDFSSQIDLSKIETIVFDFGGVLLDLYPERTIDQLEEILGVRWDLTIKQNDDYKFLYDFEKGTINMETWLWNLQKQVPQNVPSPRALINAWNAMLGGWNKEKFDVLRHLKRKYKILLLSNTNEVHLDWVYKDLVDNHEISNFEQQFFDKAYFSHLIGMRKPDLEIYEFVSKDFGLDINSTLFIDDNIENVKAAKEYGWKAFKHSVNDPISYLVE